MLSHMERCKPPQIVDLAPLWHVGYIATSYADIHPATMAVEVASVKTKMEISQSTA
jgi:hypothetical protein